MSSRVLPVEANVPSWFSRVLVLDYYDGTKEGIVKCPEGHVAVVRLLDWDDQQDTRIFGVSEDRNESFDELATLLAESESPSWPVFLPKSALPSGARRSVERLLSKANREPDYIMACENPTETIFRSKAYPEGVDPYKHDWFVEIGLARKRTEE
jgi:hypothetical protein